MELGDRLWHKLGSVCGEGRQYVWWGGEECVGEAVCVWGGRVRGDSMCSGEERQCV